jgi:hypothetical protein
MQKDREETMMAKTIKDCWHILSLSAAILLVQMSGGCVPQKQVRSSVSPPIIEVFEANPPSVTAGNISTLRWRTRNAVSAHLSGVGPVPVNGSKAVTVGEQGTYVLTATGRDGRSVTAMRGIKGYSIMGNVSNPSQKLPAPVMKSPKNGAAYRHYPRLTKLSWKPVNGAVRYGVEIDCYGCCKAKRWCTDVGKEHQIVPSIFATSYSFNFVGAQPGRWRVWAIDTKGRPGAKSNWRSFRFTR